MIEDKKKEFGWEFIFLGANIDAIKAAESLGIGKDRAVNYNCDSEGTTLNYEVISETVSCLRANKNMGVYKGALYENFVAEAFLKQGLGLYYYKKENATLEEDFFVRTKDELVPVEVKANKNRSKSLRKLIDNESYSDIKWGIKLADSNVGIENGIYTFPYFCSFLIKRYLAKKG